MDRKEALAREPNIDSHWALDIPTAGIVSPYTITIAAAENACRNGVRFHLNTQVTGIDQKEDGGYNVSTTDGEFTSRLVVNSAGLYSDEIARMAGVEGPTLYPVKGQYYILDRSLGHLITSMIYPVPPKRLNVVGVHITPTTEGNLLLGPTADYIEEKDDTATMGPVLKELWKKARELCPALPERTNIKNYAGIRARSLPQDHPDYPDYTMGELGCVEDMYQLIGIESPGVTAAPAIAEEVAGWVTGKLDPKPNEAFDPRGRPVVRFHKLPVEKRMELAAADPDYTRMVCRCEHVTRAEVLQALDNPLGVRTLAGIKYRCRAQMGRCQGGFCTARIVEIMEEKYGYAPEDFRLKGPGSHMFTSRTKEPLMAEEARVRGADGGGDER
jgi:glycerol-3-phosphate dehydrogenase